MPSEFCVVVANEPRSYREVLAGALRGLRPTTSVIMADPAELDRQIARLSPYVVVCSVLTDIVRSAPGWIMMYPNGEPQSVISLGGEQVTTLDLQFDGILALIDRAELLCRTAGGPRRD